MNKIIGAKIAEIRKRVASNQAEFGRMIGAKQGNVSKWERGISEPDIDALLNIAKLGGTTVAWLINENPVNGIIVKNENGDVHVSNTGNNHAAECPNCKALERENEALKQTISTLKDMVELLKQKT